MITNKPMLELANANFSYWSKNALYYLDTVLLADPHSFIWKLLQSEASLAKMGIKWFNRVALLDFPNVIKPNESNPDSKTSHFAILDAPRKCIHGVTNLSLPM